MPVRKWTKEWPKKEGYYWFYGYRYGRISCSTSCDPEYCLVDVRKCANGMMFTTNGQFLFKSEPEEAHFQKVDLPELPPNFKH